ncbi:MAG: hypothetical protein ACRYGR_05330 [Janthinobacterium lividum]
MTLKYFNLKIWTLLIFGFLAGCNTIFKDADREGEPQFNLETINIILDQDANNTSATAVDLVITYKPELMKALTKMTADDYFKVADQIRRDYPETLRIWRWELTPGQTVTDYSINSAQEIYDPFGAIVFARYFTPGSHCIRVGSSDTIHVLVKKDDLCIIEQGCPGMPVILPTKDDPTSKTPQDIKKMIQEKISKCLKPKCG